ncbi:MAG: hypothetical protein U1F26_17850 [Lysobacterales bacterium]
MFENIKELLPKLKKEKERLLTTLAEGDARIDELKRERSALLQRPISRGDYVQLICNDIDRRAAAVGAQFAAHVATNAKRDRYWPAKVESALQHREGGNSVVPVSSPLVGMHLDAWQSAPEFLKSEVAIWLLAEPIKEAVKKATLDGDWPFSQPIDAKEALARIDAIDGEVLAIQMQQRDLRQEAEALGVDLAAP